MNKPRDPTQNYRDFAEGQDFYEGRDVNKGLVYENLNYEQFSVGTIETLVITLIPEGELVARVGQDFTYDDGALLLWIG